jgi:hypothetical protein
MYRERTVSKNVLCINNKKSFSVPDNQWRSQRGLSPLYEPLSPLKIFEKYSFFNEI